MNTPMASLFSPFQQVFDHFWNIPITNWQRFFNPQMVFNYNPQDEGVEYHVLQRVGSYGHQLSTILSMLELLRATLPADDELNADQRATLERFERLRTESQRAVAQYRGAPGTRQVVDYLKALRARDPQAYAALQAEVETDVDGTAAAPRPSTRRHPPAKHSAPATRRAPAKAAVRQRH